MIAADGVIDIFFSHTACDRALVAELTNEASALGVRIYTYEEDPRPGEPIAAKLQGKIQASEAVLALLTADGATSSYVQQEIGFAIRAGKLVVPLVEEGVSRARLGMLDGVEYIPFKRGDIDSIRLALRRWFESILTNAKAAATVAKSHEEMITLALMTVALLLIVTYYAAKN